MEEDEERPCYDRGNGSPYCSPIPTDTWKNGTQHQFVWNYNHPFYVTSEYLSLYLYYKENYAYQPVKNWTSIRRADGTLAVQVDNSWFPPNTTRTPVYGYYLPAGMNPLKELSNPESQYPHPFNFTIERPQLPSLDDSSGGDGHHSSLPGWAIALITVFSIGAVALAAFLLALCIRRRRHDQQQHHHDIYPVGYDPYHHDDEHHQQQQPVMRGVSTTTDTGSSIYSTTPMMHATFSAPRLSSGNYSSRRSSNAMAPPNTAAILNNRSAVSHSTSSFITDAPVPSTASSSRLADSTFMWMVDSSSQEHTTTTEEQRRRQLGEALLAQQLSEEEGASVKHAEKRPITVNGIRSEESRAVLEER